MKPTRNHPSSPSIARRAKEGRSGAAAGLGLRAFTLVELLVVIAIIGVLAGITYPAVESIIQRAKKNSTLALINSIDSGIEMFRTEFGHVPYNNDDGTGKIPGAVFGRQEYARLWLLGLDKDGELDGIYHKMSSRDVRAHPLWNGEYVEIKIDRHLDKDNEECAYCFVDAWGNPLYFEFYSPDDPKTTKNKPIFNISKWDIWSKGPDEIGTEDMQKIGTSSDTYETRREKWLKEKEDDWDREHNRDNFGNW